MTLLSADLRLLLRAVKLQALPAPVFTLENTPSKMNSQQILNKLFYLLLGFLTYIISVIAFLISIIHRSIIHLVLVNFYNDKYQLVKAGVPTIMAGETKGSVNVLYVLKCKGRPNFGKIVEKLYQVVKYETKTISGGESENSYRPFEKLSYVIVPKFWVFCWKIDHAFRAENHVVVEKIPNNLDIAVQEKCERLIDTIYGDHQPQWELHILVEEDSKEYALVWSVHHTFADATIFTQLIRYTLADNPFPMKIEPLEWNRTEETPFSKIRNCIESLLLCTFGSVGFAAIYGQCLGQTHIKENALTEERGRIHCRAVTVDLNKFKTIQKKVSRDEPIRLISLLYACVAPAINRALSSSKNDQPTTVLASTIEANYPYRNLELCIDVTTLWFDLPLDIAPLQERLHVIDRNVRRITGHLGMSLFKIGTVMVGTVITPIARILEESGSLTQTTYISNIVGPAKSFSIFGGDRVTSMYVYSPVSLEESATFVGYSYDGEITLAIAAPNRVVKKLPDFLDNIVEGVKDEMDKYLEFSRAN